MVAIVAVGVIFLQDLFSENRDRQNKSLTYVTYATGAVGALDLLLEWQKDLCERTRAPAGGQWRNWDFEIGFRITVLKVALSNQIAEPALVEDLARVLAWLEQAQGLLTFTPPAALTSFQSGTDERAACATRLRNMGKELLESAASFQAPRNSGWRNLRRVIRRNRN